jgi:HAMP domain-containing protein
MNGKSISDFLATLVVLLAVFVALISVFVANYSRPQSYLRRVARKYSISPLNLRG